MPGIDIVTMTHFRGATGTTEVKLGGVPLVVVHGGNGTGKSTIADAINLICNRTGGSLKDRSSTSLTTAIPSAGWAGEPDVSVSLSAGKETWKWAGAFVRQGIGAVTPETPAPPALFVLRRSNLLKLTEAAPAQRYSELGRLIDIPNVEANEVALERIRTQATTTMTQAQAVYDARRADLNRLWEEAGSPLPDAKTWAVGASAIDENAHALLERLTALITSHEAAGAALKASQKAEEVKRGAAQTMAERKKALSDYMEQAGLTWGDVDTLSVLEAAVGYLKAAAEGYPCPVCRQPVDLETIRAEADARLEGLSQLRSLIRSWKDAEALLNKARAETVTRREDVIVNGRALAAIARTSRVEAVEWLGIQWEHYPALAAAPGGAAAENPVQEVKDLWMAFSRTYDGATPHLIGLSVIEGLKADRDMLTGRVGAAQNLQNVLEALRKAEEVQDVALRQLNAWSGVCEIVKEQRQEFVTALFQTLLEDCGALYSQIHPDEAILLTDVKVDGAGAGRALTMIAEIPSYQKESQQKKVHEGTPQAYLSDSHLDTLGFCFWLAAVRHYSKGNAVVLLDDVFTSADEEHQKRILGLLQEQTMPEKNGPAQIILLTHSNAWRNAVRAGANQYARLIELAPWTYDEGVHAAEG